MGTESNSGWDHLSPCNRGEAQAFGRCSLSQGRSFSTVRTCDALREVPEPFPVLRLRDGANDAVANLSVLRVLQIGSDSPARERGDDVCAGPSKERKIS